MGEPTPVAKRCYLCQGLLPAAAFNRRRASRDGLAARCKDCDSAYKRTWRTRNAEHIRAYGQQYYTGERRERAVANARARWAAKREELNAARRAKRAADPEQIRAQARAYRAANAATVKEWKRRYYERHSDAVRAKRKADYAADPEKFRQRVLQWQRDNPELTNERNARHRARLLNATIGEVTPALLAGKLAYWGDACWMCGGEWTDWDHVKPLAAGGPHMLANLRPACDFCNSSKRHRWPFPLAWEILRPGER